MDKWRTSSAEQQNMDGSYLNKLHDKYDSFAQIAIIKNGYLIDSRSVTNIYKLEHIHSCTKSIVSLLYGMVFKPDTVNRKIISIFPMYTRNDNQDVTIYHLLTMTSGMDWSDLPNIDSKQLQNETDWVSYILSKRITKKPGDYWNYNSGGSQIVSVIIQNELSFRLEKYIENKLFAPLGIKKYTWWKSNDGYLTAGWGLFLSIYDLSKIGYLLLNNGKWKDKTIISNEWINEVSSRKVKIDSDFSYGLQWWIYDALPFAAYKAYGRYGDHSVMMIIIPQYNTEIIITGNINNEFEILKQYIIPALVNN